MTPAASLDWGLIDVELAPLNPERFYLSGRYRRWKCRDGFYPKYCTKSARILSQSGARTVDLQAAIGKRWSSAACGLLSARFERYSVQLANFCKAAISVCKRICIASRSALNRVIASASCSGLGGSAYCADTGALIINAAHKQKHRKLLNAGMVVCGADKRNMRFPPYWFHLRAKSMEGGGARRNGDVLRDRYPGSDRGPSMADRPDELRGEACRLLESGLSIPLIARRLDRRHNSVTGRLMTLARREARREARTAQPDHWREGRSP